MTRSGADLRVVSPYLHFAGHNPSTDLMARLDEIDTTQLQSGELAILFDALDHRIILVSRGDYENLVQLKNEPSQISAYAQSFPTAFERLIQADLLVAEHDISSRHALKCIEIEINSHCNYRCTFCPVETAPKPKSFMPPDLYKNVLHRVREYGANNISLNHFSEPTLDRNLIERIELAAKFDLSVQLFTNASNFDDEKIRRIAEIGNTRVIVNLPTVSREEYAKITGAKLLERVLANLELLHIHGINVELSINAPRDSADETTHKINQKLSVWFGEAAKWPTDDRGGRLGAPQYATSTRHDGRLSGCILALNDLSVNHKGQAFLCCQDFDQDYIVGDLNKQSIREIVEGDRALAIRRMILGLESPEPDLICTRCAWTSSIRENPTELTFWAEGKFSSRAYANFVRRSTLIRANSETGFGFKAASHA